MLREMNTNDFGALHGIFSDAETMRYYPVPFTGEMVRKWIRWNRDSYRDHGYGLWAMVLRETGAVIGDCGLIYQDVHGRRIEEIGYHVAKEYWCRGYATEAARAVQAHAFTRLKLPMVISMIRPENIPSRRVAEKIGMTILRTVAWKGFTHHIYHKGNPLGSEKKAFDPEKNPLEPENINTIQ